jgi:hypothetical protein
VGISEKKGKRGKDLIQKKGGGEERRGFEGGY